MGGDGSQPYGILSRGLSGGLSDYGLNQLASPQRRHCRHCRYGLICGQPRFCFSARSRDRGIFCSLFDRASYRAPCFCHHVTLRLGFRRQPRAYRCYPLCRRLMGPVGSQQ